MSNIQSLTLRLQAAFTRPYIPHRCNELTEIINDLSAKDASYVFRTIVDSVFEVPRDDTVRASIHYAGGWGLRFITTTEHSNEFNTLREFLAAKGPLLNLAFRITNDPFQLFPFPVSWLPSKVRIEIEEGSAMPFYSHKIQNLGPGKLPVNIMLNAFEYYMFNFAHFLLGNISVSAGGGYWASTAECLYPTLVEDLLIAFMPLDASFPPGPSGMPIAPTGLLSPMPQRITSGPNLNLSNIMSPILRPQKPADFVGNLMDNSVGGSMGRAYTSSPVTGNANRYMHSQTEFSTWSSQVVLQILLEKWVNQCITVQTKFSSSHVTNTYNSAQEIFVPSCDHVYIVRILIKHLHYFCNSIKPQQQLPLDQLRRSVWGMSRKIIYMFMKHLFLHWPLDSSFKLVLETWLSFIQPWRYTVYVPRNKLAFHSIETEVNRLLDRKWMDFISENLLFYTYLFELLLGRILRLDLASTKNAHILFRVSKVYAQDKFVEFIEEIEETIGQNVQKSLLGDFLGNPSRTALPESQVFRTYPSDHLISTHSISQAARNHILEVEGQRHRYECLLSVNIIDKVQCLLKYIKKATEAISQEIAADTAKKFSDDSHGMLAYFISVFTRTPKSMEEKQRIEEMQKSLTFLQLSSNHLCTIFKTSPPLSVCSFDTSSIQQPNYITPIIGEKRYVPDQIFTENGLVLSQLGQMQILSGLKRFDIKYEGDPDLKPICSYEVTFLVRFFYALSIAINLKYELSMTRYYYRRDFMGKLSRVFLQPPEIIYYDNTQEGNRKKLRKTLPPRISLRYLASRPRICLLLAFWLIFSVLGISMVRICTHMIFPFAVIFVIGKALLEPSAKLELSLNIRDINEQTSR